MKTNIPVLSFIARNVTLLILVILCVGLSLNDAVFREAGPLAYIPVLFLLACALAILFRHLFWRSTADEFARTGEFRSAWWMGITAAERLRWTIGITLWLIACACLIASSIAR